MDFTANSKKTILYCIRHFTNNNDKALRLEEKKLDELEKLNANLGSIATELAELNHNTKNLEVTSYIELCENTDNIIDEQVTRIISKGFGNKNCK